MDIIEAVKARKSIRGFKPDPVPKEIIKEILEIAVRAPSANNTQPWEFVVLSGEALDDVRRANLEAFSKRTPFDPGIPLPSVKWGEPYRGRQLELGSPCSACWVSPRMTFRPRWPGRKRDCAFSMPRRRS